MEKSRASPPFFTERTRQMPAPALLPVEIRVFDAAGRELDGAGYACAKDGVCRLSVRTNLNDAPGAYKVVCRDRASGLACESVHL